MNTNCPNCGAPITGTNCEYCGTVFHPEEERRRIAACQEFADKKAALELQIAQIRMDDMLIQSIQPVFMPQNSYSHKTDIITKAILDSTYLNMRKVNW